jgi:hypothetical protein
MLLSSYGEFMTRTSLEQNSFFTPLAISLFLCEYLSGHKKNKIKKEVPESDFLLRTTRVAPRSDIEFHMFHVRVFSHYKELQKYFLENTLLWFPLPGKF